MHIKIIKLYLIIKQDIENERETKNWEKVSALLLFSHCYVQLFVAPWTKAYQASLSFTISRSLLRLMTIEVMMPTISSFATPFSSCPQSFPESESFPMSCLFTSGDQSIEASASASVLTMNIQCWFPLGLTGFVGGFLNKYWEK